MPGQPEKEALRVGDVVNVSRKAAVGEGGLAIIVSVPSESGGLYSVKYTAGRSEKGLPRSALTLQRNAYEGDRAMRRKSVEEEEEQQQQEEEEDEDEETFEVEKIVDKRVRAPFRPLLRAAFSSTCPREGLTISAHALVVCVCAGAGTRW